MQWNPAWNLVITATFLAGENGHTFSCKKNLLVNTANGLILKPQTVEPFFNFTPLVQYSATQPFLVSSRNAPPHEWGGALHDDAKNGCVADYLYSQFVRNFKS